MSDSRSRETSLPELARARREELARPHPADVEAERLREELADAERQIQRARRGAKSRGAQRLSRQKAARRAIGLASRRRRSASTVATLIEQRDQALRSCRMWQWISSTQTPELVRGLTTSRDIATERAEAAEAEVRRLTVLLRDMGVRSHDTEKRLWAAQEDILSLDDALARATRYRQEAAQWMDHAHRLLSELLPTLGPPPTPPLHWRD